MLPPYDAGLLRGEISSEQRALSAGVVAKGKNGELRSGSVTSHAGLAGSYSLLVGAGMFTIGQAGCAGSYSSCFDIGNGGRDGMSRSGESWRANGDELSSSPMSVDGLER